MRKFYLVNEKNIRYDLQAVRTYGFLSDVSDLGYENGYSYTKIGETFHRDSQETKQRIITGIVSVWGYENYAPFIDYLENSEDLRLIYAPVDKEYFLDVDVESIGKGERKGHFLQCPIKFNAKSLFYTDTETRFVVETVEGDSSWDLTFPFVWNDYAELALPYVNLGHTEAEMIVEIYGPAQFPSIELYVNDVRKAKVEFNISIPEGQCLIYSARDKENFIMLEDDTGTQTSIPNVLKLENNNFFKLPKGACTLKVKSQTGYLYKVIMRILTAYKGV